MAVLTSSLDTAGETCQANRAAQLALLGQLGEQLELAIAGGGDRYQQRHRDRGKLLARERIELLVDPDSPFLELSTLAGNPAPGQRTGVPGVGQPASGQQTGELGAGQSAADQVTGEPGAGRPAPGSRSEA